MTDTLYSLRVKVDELETLVQKYRELYAIALLDSTEWKEKHDKLKEEYDKMSYSYSDILYKKD